VAVQSETSVVRLLREAAIPLSESPADYDPLLEAIGGARLVLLGEASHGTHEFYRERAAITERLIRERGFIAVAVEADWPDAYRVNRYVRGRSADASPTEALAGFTRFPAWMWRNADVLDFVGWLREWNDTQSPENRAGFYGLDLYSLFASLEAVIQYLEKVDRPAADEARRRYACFEHFSEQAQAYGYAASSGLMESCEARSSGNWSSSGGGRLNTSAGMARSRKRSTSTQSRTPGSRRTPRPTTGRCIEARRHRGTSAIGTCSRRYRRSSRFSTRTAPQAGAPAPSSGRTTRTSATRARRKCRAGAS
jgi:hypothetical protein